MKLNVHELRKNNFKVVNKNLIKAALFLLVFSIFSCSKDDDAQAPDLTDLETNQYRIKETKFINNGNSTTSFYSYNAQNLVVKTTYSTNDGQFSYEYDNNSFLIKSEYKSTQNPSNNSVTTYSRDNQGRVLVKMFIPATLSLQTKQENVYNSFGLESTTEFKYNAGSMAFAKTEKTIYTYNNSNLTKTALFYKCSPLFPDGELDTTTTYTYNANGLESSRNVLYSDNVSRTYYTTYNSSGQGISYLDFFTDSDPFATEKKVRDFQNTFDVIKPVAYKNISAEFLSFKIKRQIDQQFSTISGALTSNTTTNVSYKYNKAGYVTEKYKEGVLFETHVLEKIK